MNRVWRDGVWFVEILVLFLNDGSSFGRFFYIREI